jgi:hypothetical protein
MFDLRLVACSPFGIRLGSLPHPLSVEVGWPLNDVPSLKLNYIATVTGAASAGGSTSAAAIRRASWGLSP